MQITKHLWDDIFNNGEIFFVLEYTKILLLKLIKLVDSVSWPSSVLTVLY